MKNYLHEPIGLLPYNDLLPDDKKLYKTVLYRVREKGQPDEYRINVGMNQIRIYDSETLPGDIKVKMAFIAVHTCDPPNITYVQGWPYSSTFPPEYDQVGWQWGKNEYTVVISYKLLWEMKGKEDDTGKKS